MSKSIEILPKDGQPVFKMSSRYINRLVGGSHGQVVRYILKINEVRGKFGLPLIDFVRGDDPWCNPDKRSWSYYLLDKEQILQLMPFYPNCRIDTIIDKWDELCRCNKLINCSGFRYPSGKDLLNKEKERRRIDKEKSGDMYMGEMAEFLTKNGVEMNEDEFVKWLKNYNYIKECPVSGVDVVGDKVFGMGLFCLAFDPDIDKHPFYRVIVVTKEGQEYFLSKLLLLKQMGEL